MVDDPTAGLVPAATSPDAWSLDIERAFSATPERVFRALTDETELAAWFWPASLRVKVTAHPEPGGALRIEGQNLDPDKPYEMAVVGRYELAHRPDRLTFSWRWDGEADETLVRVELSPTDQGTRLALTHEGFADEATRDDHGTGWSDCLDRLPAHLATTPS